MQVETLLNVEIAKELKELGRMELGTDAYKATVDGICKMTDKTLEFRKVRIARDDKTLDYEMKESQMANEKKEKRIRVYLDVAGIVVPVAVTIWGTFKTFKFESTGTVTTIFGRKFINNLMKRF